MAGETLSQTRKFQKTSKTNEKRCYMTKSTLKISRYCPLVIQGFSNFLGLFQGIMVNPANPVLGTCLQCLVTFVFARFGVLTRGRSPLARRTAVLCEWTTHRPTEACSQAHQRRLVIPRCRFFKGNLEGDALVVICNV